MATTPLAPTLTAPRNAAYIDLAATGGPFVWRYNNTDGSTQASYRFRRKLSGATGYEYWNAGSSAFQASEVDNPLSSQTVTFPGTVWADGNGYQWSTATTSSFALLGAYANDLTVFASAPPVTTVTGPSGAQSTQPLVAWTVAVQAGLAQVQTAYRVIIEGGTYGTAPGAGTVMYDSGLVSGGATQLQLATALPYSAAYRAFVQITVTGSQASAYASSTFTVAIPANPLAQSVMAAAWDLDGQRTVLTVQGRDNILSANQASLETDATGWPATGNCTVARSTAQAFNGLASLALTSTAAGNINAGTPLGTGGLPVIPGTVYTILGSFRGATIGQNSMMWVVWYDASGTSLSTTIGPGTFSVTTDWTQAVLTDTAPARAAFAQVLVWVNATAAAGEVHYVDAISMAPGTSTVWTRGGATGQVGVVVERSSDSGATWTAIRASGTLIPAATQLLTIYDLEPPLNVFVQYRSYQPPHPLLWDIDNWDDPDAIWTV